MAQQTTPYSYTERARTMFALTLPDSNRASVSRKT